MKSLWQDTANLPSFPTLQEGTKTDVLIIGGGIAGLLTAYFLKEKGIDYILVEKDKICSGVTGNTTAKITYQHSLIFHKLIKNYGADKAKLYYESNRLALEKYREMCLSIDCEFEEKSNFVYSLDNMKKLEKELQAAEILGVPMKYVKAVPLPLDTVGAVMCENQAQFHPLKFLSAVAKDLNIYESTFVSEVRDGTTVTDKGNITAEKIVVATHFPFIDSHGSYYMKMYQSRSYVIALEGAVDVEGMYIDECDKGLSFRNYGELLLLGGGSHRTGKKGGSYSELRAFRKQHYPTSREKYHWAAQDPITLDGAPYIGHYSKRTHDMYVMTGFNKWGMTGAMCASMIVSDMLCGKDSPYKDAFSPHRSMIKPQLFLNGAETALNFLTPTKKRCSHLGCALKWNSAEKSWDCPCHGSRFDESGRVLDGPANKDISTL